MGVTGRRELDRAVLADLRYAAFQASLDADQKPEPGRFLILGTEFTYLAAIDPTRSRLFLLTATRASVVGLEQRRERSYQPHAEFVFGEPQRPADAQAQLEALAQELDEFLEGQRLQQQAQEEQEIFRAWRGILQLKTDLQRKQGRPLRYRSFERGGRGRVVFHLSEDPVGVEVDEVRVVSLPHGHTLFCVARSRR